MWKRDNVDICRWFLMFWCKTSSVHRSWKNIKIYTLCGRGMHHSINISCSRETTTQLPFKHHVTTIEPPFLVAFCCIELGFPHVFPMSTGWRDVARGCGRAVRGVLHGVDQLLAPRRRRWDMDRITSFEGEIMFFFLWVVGAKPAGLKFWEKTLESQGILEHQDFPNGLMAFLRVSP